VWGQKRGKTDHLYIWSLTSYWFIFFFWLEKYCPRNSGVKNDNGTNGWLSEVTMDIPCDRPAVMHRSVAVCFGRYRALAFERSVAPDFVLTNPDLQNWPQRHAILRSGYIRNEVNDKHFHKILRQQKFLLLWRSLTALTTGIVTSAWGLSRQAKRIFLHHHD